MRGENMMAFEAFARLEAHAESMRGVHMRDLFARDAGRFQRFSASACGLLVDYSKNRITDETLQALFALGEEAGLNAAIADLFGGRAVNTTEKRPALHMALRYAGEEPFPSAQWDVMPEVRVVRERMRAFAGEVRSGRWRGFGGRRIEAVVNIGIGGSDLGPAMAMHALAPYQHPDLRAFFVSNIDSGALVRVLQAVDPETTLFIVASKTFSTQETLMNAKSARAWLIDHHGSEQAVANHFVAVSTATERVRRFGIDTRNMFPFWEWVGGRYSVWSAIGLSLVIVLGMERFEAFLAGAAEMDEHFRHTGAAHHLPVVLGLLGVWYRNFLGVGNHVVLPYDQALERLPAYLQQLEMESNGKHVSRSGEPLDYDTCPIVWGGLGNNAQHAFYQLLHQGTSPISADMIVALGSQYPLPGHEAACLANALAQSEALMRGGSSSQAGTGGADGAQRSEARDGADPQRCSKGNQPTNTIVYERLTPRILGALVALYEHKVYVQSVCWGINPFDQWGVELGKQLASVILRDLQGEQSPSAHDASTQGLIDYARQRRRARGSGTRTG